MRLFPAALAALLVVAANACSDGTPSTAPTQDNSASTPNLALAGGTGSSAAYQSRLFPDMCVSVVVPYANAKLLETWSCHFGANQQFIWNYAGGPSGTIVPTNSRALCWDAKGGAGRDGDPIQLWTCYGAPQQKWYATAAGEIRGINDKCIGLATAVRANGTKLTLQPCNGSSSQKWDNAATATAPPPPTTTPPPPTLPPGIAIAPGQSIQALVNANPAGTTFIIKAGTHIRQSVIPKSGDRFFGEPGAVLDGQDVAQYAFSKGNAPYPSNVTISGLKITAMCLSLSVPPSRPAAGARPKAPPAG